MKSSEHLLNLLFTENPQPMWIYRLSDFKIVEFNSAAVSLYGYSAQEFLQQTMLDMVAAEDRHRVTDASALLDGEQDNEWEIKHLTKSGCVFWVKIFSRPIVFQDQKCRLVIVQDIQERMNFQEALQSTKYQLKSILDHSLDLICSVDQQGIFVQCNNASKAIMGFEPEEIIGKPFMEFMLEEDLAPSADILKKAVQGQSIVNFQNRLKGKNGNIVYLDWSTRWDNIRQRTFSIGRDVTHAVKAKEERQKYIERITNVLESITDGFFAVDKNWIVTYWNAEAERILRVSRTEVLNKNLWEVFAEAVPLQFYSQYQKAIATHTVVRFEEYFPPLEMWIDVTAYPGTDGLSVYFKDVTQAKNQQIALEQSRERFELVSMATEDIVWEHDFITHEITWTNAIESNLGYKNDDSVKQEAFWFDNIHPEDKDRVISGIFKAVEKGGKWQDAYRFKAADGTYKYFIDRGYVIKNSEGESVKMIGTMQDVTQLKAKELEVQEHNKRLSEIAYINSHVLRRPVANILGLVEIAQCTSPEELPVLLSLIKESSLELDSVIKHVADKANRGQA